MDEEYSKNDFGEICTKMGTDLIEVTQELMQWDVTEMRLLHFGFCKEISLPTLTSLGYEYESRNSLLFNIIKNSFVFKDRQCFPSPQG
jgi:hypothetical protein